MALESPFANLYESVAERIKTKVPGIKYIDQDLGQLENYGLRPAVSFPCVLTDSDEFEYSDAGNEAIQLADGFLIIRLGIPAWSSSAKFSPAGVREKALEYFEVEQQIVKALHHWAPTGFSKLQRRKARTEKREDDIRVRIIVFAVQFSDMSCVPVRTTIPRPGLKIGDQD